MKQFSLKRASCLLAVAGLFTLTPAFAKEPADADAGNGSKSANAKVSVEDGTSIPAVLEKLELSTKQQSSVKDIIRKYDAELVSTWKQFSGRYLETVAMEASMLAAIEDGLNEAQRKQVRENRRKAAQQLAAEKSASTKGAPARSKVSAADQPTESVDEEVLIIGIAMTPDQEASADKVHGNYFNHLRSLKRDIHSLHTRLVSLEAEKIVEIEKVLTEGQLKQLHDMRQKAPAPLKVTSSKRSSAVSETSETKTE